MTRVRHDAFQGLGRANFFYRQVNRHARGARIAAVEIKPQHYFSSIVVNSVNILQILARDIQVS
jgi:hypothetical protein